MQKWDYKNCCGNQSCNKLVRGVPKGLTGPLGLALNPNTYSLIHYKCKYKTLNWVLSCRSFWRHNSAFVYIRPWCILGLGAYSALVYIFKLLGLDVYSAFPHSLPLCILDPDVYFKQLGPQVFRPTSQSVELQSTLQPSAWNSSRELLVSATWICCRS